MPKGSIKEDCSGSVKDGSDLATNFSRPLSMQSQSPDERGMSSSGEQMTFRTYYICSYLLIYLFFASGKAAGHSYLMPANHTNMYKHVIFDLIWFGNQVLELQRHPNVTACPVTIAAAANSSRPSCPFCFSSQAVSSEAANASISTFKTLEISV